MMQNNIVHTHPVYIYMYIYIYICFCKCTRTQWYEIELAFVYMCIYVYIHASQHDGSLVRQYREGKAKAESTYIWVWCNQRPMRSNEMSSTATEILKEPKNGSIRLDSETKHAKNRNTQKYRHHMASLFQSAQKVSKWQHELLKWDQKKERNVYNTHYLSLSG